MRPHPCNIDSQVGNAIRVQRVIKRLSQSALGERVGISFQQIQKYERGANRVSAGMLIDLAHALEVDVRVFFDEAFPPKNSPNANDDHPITEEFEVSREGMLLTSAYFSITNKALRKSLLQFIQTLAGKQTVDSDAEKKLD